MKRWLLAFCLFVIAENIAIGRDSKTLKTKDKAKKEHPAIAIVVCQKSKVKKLSIAQVRNIFLRKTSGWYVLERKSTLEIKKQFLKHVLKMDLDEWKEYWMRQRIQRGLLPPKALRRSYTVLRYVSRKKNAISYIYLSYLSRKKYEKFRKKVRVVLVIPLEKEESQSKGKEKE